MTGIVSFIVGYITISNSNDILEYSLKREILNNKQTLENHIETTKQKLENVSIKLIQSEQLIATLNLISNYEDKNNYNALLFDKEKKALLEYLERYFGQDDFFEILVYDKLDNLVAQKIFSSTLGEDLYVTYEKGVGYLNSVKNQQKLDTHNNLATGYSSRSKTQYKNNQYTLYTDKIIDFDGKKIGHVDVIYHLTKEGLDSLEKSLIYPISLTLHQPSQEDSHITPLDRELGVYIKHHIDFSYIEQKNKELIVKITLALLFLTLLLFLLSFIFLKNEVLRPLQKLQDSLVSIMNNKYEPIAIINNDEIGTLFQITNKIFEKFWQSYSSLKSYQESVDISNLVSKTDLKGNIIYVNEFFCTVCGYKESELIGKPHNIVRHPDTPKEVFKQMWETIKSGQVWRGIIKNKTKSGGYYWADAVVTPTYDANEKINGYISIRREITELIDKKEELEFRANYDLLTNLKNRNKLHRDLEGLTHPCLALINIDRFSQINDFYGHSFGDKLLQVFSKIVQNELDKKCVDRYSLYRYGGDEFVVLLEKYEQKKVLEKFSNFLETIEKSSIEIEGKVLNLNLSCGISFEEASQALLSADMALKLSKKERKSLVVYSQENSLNKKYENNLMWAGKLKTALEENRVVPFFQPIVNNTTLAFEKYEALVRIVEVDGKVISPFFFLDISKQTKQYLALTKIMVEKSFEMFRSRHELEFSINLTMEDISNQAMREFLFRKFDANPDIAKRLVLEIVESESLEDYKQVIEFITMAKSKGCKIAIDDFGSGYSNFEYLVKLQADYIKIDGSLIKNINLQKESFVVVSTIVSFAKKMGIKTIAEFIEDEQILKTAQELGIDYSQGYHFSAPKENLE